MKIEDFEEMTNVIYCAMNGIKLLGICEMWLPQLKETTWHGLRWNNSPVSQVVLRFFFFLFFFFVVFPEFCYLYASM